MRQHFRTAANFFLVIALMLLIAGAGAYAADGIQFGGRALVDIVPTEEIKWVATTAFRHQTLDITTKYFVEVLDQAINLEISTYDHFLVVFNLVVSMPDDTELLSLSIAGDTLYITGTGRTQQAAETFADNLSRRGFFLEDVEVIQDAEGGCVFYFEIPVRDESLAFIRM